MPLQRWRMIRLRLLQLENCIVKNTHASQSKKSKKKKQKKDKIEDPTPIRFSRHVPNVHARQWLHVTGLWAERQPGCRKQSTARKQKNMRKELSPGLSASPHFWAGQCALLHLGLVTSVYLHDRETHASPVRTPPRILLPPLENLGLSCQGPATQTAPSGQGRNSERSRRVKESQYTFF